ncbi:MAG: hypothetical protein ACRDD8_06245 [Bacteroidales bacterium]
MNQERQDEFDRAQKKIKRYKDNALSMLADLDTQRKTTLEYISRLDALSEHNQQEHMTDKDNGSGVWGYYYYDNLSNTTITAQIQRRACELRDSLFNFRRNLKQINSSE